MKITKKQIEETRKKAFEEIVENQDKIIENHKEIEGCYKKIINGYKKLVRHYRIYGTLFPIMFFWLGYLYGYNNDFFMALAIMSLFVILHIWLEKSCSTKKRWRKSK